MKTLVLKALRDIKSMRLRSASIALMVALGTGTYAGLLMSRQTLFHTRDAIYEDLHLADLRVITTPADPTELPEGLDRIPGVRRYVKRLVAPGAIELEDGRPLTCLVVYMDTGEPSGVNDLEILEGQGLRPDKPHSVVAERSLAEIHAFGPGKKLVLDPYTNPTEVEIIGTAISPQYLIATVDATVFLPMKGSLGIVYAPMALVASTFGYPLYNEFSFLFDEGADRARTEEQILERLTPLGIESSIRRNEEFAYRVLDETMKGFSSFIPSLVIVFSAIIFVVTLLTANRLVITQRKQIGVLRSLGYRRWEVSASYLFVALTLSFVGALLGAGICLVIDVLFAGSYGRALGLPKIVTAVVPRYFVEGSLLTTGIVLVAFAIPLAAMGRLTPHQILRDERLKPFKGVPRPVEKLFAALCRATASSTGCFLMGARNLFRRPGITGTTILCVGLSIGLAGALSIVLASIQTHKRTSMAREHWDIMVNFRYPVSLEEVGHIANASGIDRFVPGIAGFAQVRIDGSDLDYRLLGFPASGWMRQLDLVQGRMFSSDSERAIILNDNWIDKKRFDLRIGKTVLARAGGRQEPLTIVGLMNDMTVGQAYVPFGTAQELFDARGGINGLMATVSLPLEKVKQSLYGHEAVKEVFGLADIDRAMDEYLQALEGIHYSSVGVSVFIALFFLLASVLLNIGERETEFATLRAVGYSRGMISRIVLTELFAEALTALLLSIPVAVALGFFINYRQGQIYFHIPTVVSWPGLLAVSLWSLVLVPLASIPGLRHLFGLDIARVFREKAIG